MEVGFLPLLIILAGLYWWVSPTPEVGKTPASPTPVEPGKTQAPPASPAIPDNTSPRPVERPTVRSEKSDPVPRKTFQDCDQCPEMVIIPSGDFQMGSQSTELGRNEDEGPAHYVGIEAFAVGRYEVTVGQFEIFVRDTDYRTDAEKNTSDTGGCFAYKGGTIFGWKTGSSYRDPGWRQTSQVPAVCISWNDAQAYLSWLTTTTGKAYRLPSEAELEYIIRAGSTTRYSWGSNGTRSCRAVNGLDLSASSKFRNDDIAPCRDAYMFTSPVGSFKPNAFGLYDTSGNVWEFAQDCWHDYYEDAPFNGVAWEEGGDCSRRVMRGGSWFDGTDFLRSANRGIVGNTQDSQTQVGFRVARNLIP